MLYKKNGTKDLDKKLFQNPTCEYRGAPFWAWNTKLEKDELLWQIDRLKEMGEKFNITRLHTDKDELLKLDEIDGETSVSLTYLV